MVFDLNNKVALVTGAASGIGLSISKEFLKQGCKGVTLMDINRELGEKVLDEIETEFGLNRAIFFHGDVTIMEQFEDAFRKTLENFQHVDILINNAGFFSEHNYERMITINITGVANGIMLGFENYLPKYKQGEEALIVNISSISGLYPMPTLPIYGATKSAIINMTRAWGVSGHYNRNHVRLITVCPGVTVTPLLNGYEKKVLNQHYLSLSMVNTVKPQGPEFVASELIKIMETSENGTTWVIAEECPAYEYIFPTKEDMNENQLISK